MRCDEIQALLIEAADGTLGGPLQAEVERHLGNCPPCRAEAAALRELLQTVAADPVPEPPEAYWRAAREEVARRLGRRSPPLFPPTRPRLRLWALAGAAAIFLLALANALLTRRDLPPPVPTGPTPEEVALLRDLEVVQELELLEQVDILQDYELLRTIARQDRAT